MTTRENIALARRVADLEDAIGASELLLVRTTLVVVGRGDEPRWAEPGNAIHAADRPPSLVVLERRPDLQLLMHPASGARVLRHDLDASGLLEFDALAGDARLVDVEITCHRKQVPAILATAPTHCTTGGNRSGKSRVLAWWLFRRWMLRGHAASDEGLRGHVSAALFWWLAPTLNYAYQYGVELLAGPRGRGGGLWPDEVFASLRGVSEHDHAPRLDLIDGSTLAFLHGHHSGNSAGDNVISANVTDAAIDELARIKSVETYQQVQARVSQSGGRVAIATTRKRGHWLRTEIEDVAADSAGAVEVSTIDIFDNPWMTRAACWKLLLSDGTYNANTLRGVLAADDIDAAARDAIKRPRSRMEHLGLEDSDALLLWPEWRNDYIYPQTGRQTRLVVEGDDGPRTLIDITRHVLARQWPREAARGERFDAWAGTDWNVNARAVVMQVFGEPTSAGPSSARVASAVANRASWHVLVVGESASTGTTKAHAKALRERHGLMPVWCDPHGARGDEARGSEDSTDIGEFRRAGFPIAPAGGVDRQGRHIHIPRTDSHNVVHHMMAGGRLRVSPECEGLLDALRHEEVTPKRAAVDSLSDSRSGYTDALKYGLWPMFADEVRSWEVAA